MPLLFATQDYQYLKKTMMDLEPRYDDGQIEVKYFPDGERYQCISTSVRDRDVVFVSGTHNDATTLELFDAACAIVAYGARSLTLAIPYYGYSTMERAKPMSREVVTAKTRARILSALPKAYLRNRVVLFDLHSEGIPHYFGDGAHQIHAQGLPIMKAMCREILQEIAMTESVSPDDVVIGSTDAGGAKRVEYLAAALGGWEVALISKRRISGSETEVTNVNIDVSGKHVIIYDDMTRSGSSLVQAAKVFKDAGAKKVYAIISHGVFTKSPAETEAMCLGALEAIYCTDSHPKAVMMNAALGGPAAWPPSKQGIVRIKTCAEVLSSAILHHLPRGWGQERGS